MESDSHWDGVWPPGGVREKKRGTLGSMDQETAKALRVLGGSGPRLALGGVEKGCAKNA